MLTSIDSAFSKSGRKSFKILDTCIRNKKSGPETPIQSRSQSPEIQGLPKQTENRATVDELINKAIGPVATRPTRGASLNVDYSESDLRGIC